MVEMYGVSEFGRRNIHIMAAWQIMGGPLRYRRRTYNAPEKNTPRVDAIEKI